MRAHVVLRDELVEEVDRLVGKRGRSAYISEALEERLRRERLTDAMKAAAGSISATDHPEWATSAKVAAWVRRIRRQGDERLRRLDHRRTS